MADSKADLQAKKDHAKLLFINEKLTQKEIAWRTGISERTISKWVNEGNWEDTRKSVMMTREEQLRKMYSELEALNIAIQEEKRGHVFFIDLQNYMKKAKRDSITEIEIQLFMNHNRGYATKEQAYIRDTLTQNIVKLEIEISAHESFNVYREMMKYWRKLDLEVAKKLTEYFDPFIKSKMR